MSFNYNFRDGIAARQFSDSHPIKTFFARNFGMKFYVGHEQREGWRGPNPFYFFFCKKCGHFSQDYLHSYPARGYLNCHHCGNYISFPSFCAQIKESLALIWFLLSRRYQNK